MSAQAIIEAHAAVEVWKQRDQAATEARKKIDAAKVTAGSVNLELHLSGELHISCNGPGRSSLTKEQRHALLQALLADAVARVEEIEGLPE